VEPVFWKHLTLPAASPKRYGPGHREWRTEPTHQQVV
jgi:hypothetical protein